MSSFRHEVTITIAGPDEAAVVRVAEGLTHTHIRGVHLVRLAPKADQGGTTVVLTASLDRLPTLEPDRLGAVERRVVVMLQQLAPEPVPAELLREAVLGPVEPGTELPPFYYTALSDLERAGWIVPTTRGPWADVVLTERGRTLVIPGEWERERADLIATACLHAEEEVQRLLRGGHPGYARKLLPHLQALRLSRTHALLAAELERRSDND